MLDLGPEWMLAIAAGADVFQEYFQAGFGLALGLGSSRLLVAGLQNRVADTASIALVDEVEIGLEPHRRSNILVPPKSDHSHEQALPQ